MPLLILRYSFASNPFLIMGLTWELQGTWNGGETELQRRHSEGTEKADGNQLYTTGLILKSEKTFEKYDLATSQIPC